MSAARILIALAMLLLLPAVAKAANGIHDMRIGVHPDKTRIVFDLDQQSRYSTLILAGPHRLVVDISNGQWRGGKVTVPEKSGLVTGVHHAAHDASTYRFVFETLKPPKLANGFFLPGSDGGGKRLVLDVIAADGSVTSDNQLAAAAAGVAAQPAVAVPTVPPAPGSYTRRDKPLIVIDPGHGGKDPGTHGSTGIREKDLVLMMSKEMRAVFEQTGRYRVHLTREDDRYIPLRERPAIAQRKQADLFISVHADAFTKPTARGASIYTLSENTSDREAARLAAKENKADIIAGVDLSGEPDAMTASILIDLAQRETMNLSARFANTVINNMKPHVQLKSRPHGMAGFLVLTAPDVPAVLLELGFLTNPKEEWLLKQKSYRAKIANAVLKSTDDFFNWKAALNTQ